jgi:hypothetical protein
LSTIAKSLSGLGSESAGTRAPGRVARVLAASRIRWQGFGETQLKVQTGDGVNEPLNRRVEIKVVPLTQAEIDAAQ